MSRSHAPSVFGVSLPPPPVLFCLLLALYGFFRLLQWPIVALDTDLWYHLNGGRYLFQRGAIPSDSFFSFVTPPRPWTDYFWLFQALVYGLYSAFGYFGLVVFRALVYLVSALLALAFLTKDHKGSGSLVTWPALLFYFFCPFLLHRFFLVRPHVCTYCFMLLFLLILELKPRYALYLPLLAVVWCNLHGIAFPVLWLITGSYALERILHHAREPRASLRALLAFLIPTALAMAAVFVTPHGTRLLQMPGVSTASASRYIMELRPVTLLDMVSFHVPTMTPSLHTVFNLLGAALVFSVMTAISRRSLRLSHALLAAGGAVLLTKGSRFMIEFLILALPLLKANPPLRARRLMNLIPTPLYLGVAFGILILSMNFMVDLFGSRPAFPFSTRNLPVGSAVFLTRVGPGGTVLNHPNNGGYLQWMLYPRYKIYMDMEVPLLFSDEDMYVSANVYTDAGVLKMMVKRYHPTFMLVPYAAKQFPALAKTVGDYAMVFADDSDVLYVDRRQQPELAERYQLRGLDPFSLLDKGVRVVLGLDPRHSAEAATPQQRIAMVRDAGRVLSVYPHFGVWNQVVALVLNDEGAYDRALPYAERMIRSFPESPIGYLIKADALKGLRLYDQAIAAYRQGLDHSGRSEPQEETFRAMGECYLEQGQYRKAYNALQRGVSEFDESADYRDLYRYARAAWLAGKTKEARVILKYAGYKTPPEDAEMTEKVWRQQRELDR